VEGREECLFHHTAAERDEVGISEQDVQRRFMAAIESGDPERRGFVGTTLPSLDFDHADFDHDDQHPLDLRHASIRGELVANYARFEEAIDLRDAQIRAFRAKEATFSDGLYCQRATVERAVDFYNATFIADDIVFTDATFEGPVRFDQATVSKAAIFDDATFADEATFLGTEFHGRSVDIDNYTSFDRTSFDDSVRFDYAQFEAASFDGAAFSDVVHFEETNLTAPVTFDEVAFESMANFDGATFESDASFVGATFDGETRFSGATFDGGGTVLHSDADFSEVTFAEPVSFESAEIGAVSFEDALFEGDASFRDGTFHESAKYTDVVFAGEAVFAGATFGDEATFERVTFEAAADFPGVEFHGTDSHESASVSFDEATFEDDANFHHVYCLSASFSTVRFEGDVCFAESEFRERIEMKIGRIGGDTIFNFTEAYLRAGKIVQPENRWVRCDLTKATVGDITFEVDSRDNRELFRYLRFCETKFDGFDFMAHAHYLTQSNWRLHEFDEGDLEYDYAVEMTSVAIEKTYQRAKTSASAEGNVEASGKFRFKRQQYARQNYKAIARDSEEPLRTRVRNSQRVCENLFMELVCGHGMRLYRIAAVYILFPVVPAILYAFGGSLFRTEAGQVGSLGELLSVSGIKTFFTLVYFSYISFLTIGYGNVVAEGILALMLVNLEAYANVILGGLFIYALVKRSEL
jgi:uncharacterized protein YjbI with pentapeptide repeats